MRSITFFLILAGLQAAAQASVILIRPFPDTQRAEGDTIRFVLSEYLITNLEAGEDVVFSRVGANEADSPLEMTLSPNGKNLLVFGKSKWYWGSSQIKVVHVTAGNPSGSEIDRFGIEFSQVPGNNPPLFRGIDSVLREDLPMNVDLNRHFYDYDGLQPFQYALATVDSNAAYELQGSSLKITPRPDYNGPLYFALKAANSLGIQSENYGMVSVTGVNDTPRVVKPFFNVGAFFFDSVVITPDEHFIDPESGLGKNLDVGLSWDTAFAGEQRSRIYVFKPRGKPAAGSVTARAGDWHGLSREATFALSQNAAGALGARYPVPPEVGGAAYVSSPSIRWADENRNVLILGRGASTYLMDKTRRLATPPVVQDEGGCIVVDTVAHKILFLGKSGFPDSTRSPAEAAALGYWNMARHPLPSGYADGVNRCAYARYGSGFRFVRWNLVPGSGRIRAGTLDASGNFSTEASLAYSSQNNLVDVRVEASRILVLRIETFAAGKERGVVWLDVLDTLLQPVSAPVRVSFFDSPDGDTTRANTIGFALMTSTQAGLEVFWSKYDGKADVYPNHAGSRIFRKVFNPATFAPLLTRNLEVGTRYSSTGHGYGRIDRVSPNDVRLTWSTLNYSCLDASIGSVRINPLQPDSLYKDTVTQIRPDICGGSVSHFSLPYHFNDGSYLVFHMNPLPEPRSIEFQPVGGGFVAVHRARTVPAGKPVSGLRLRNHVLRVENARGTYDLSGRKVPNVPRP